LLIGMHDADSGLDLDSFRVIADFAIDGVPEGTNVADKFEKKAPGVWEWKLKTPIAALGSGKLTVSVADRQGNQSRIERNFSVEK
jgi:hypothetical protein